MAHLELIALLVKEYGPAIDFFVRVLGFDLVEDVPSLTNDGRPKRWVVVRPSGAVTGILLARADGGHQESIIGQQLAGRVGFFLRVDDFDASLERMVAAGVQFVTQPRTEAYGQVAVFLDIAGNRWDLLGPARFPTREHEDALAAGVRPGPSPHGVHERWARRRRKVIRWGNLAHHRGWRIFIKAMRWHCRLRTMPST